MNATASKPPIWYWVVSTLALLWMLFGALMWWMDLTMDPAALAQMSEAQQQLYASRPQWLFVIYAIAIFSGLLGSIGLLLRKRWAMPLFALSLVAIVIQFGYIFIAMHAIELLGAAEAVSFPVVIFAIGAGLWWLSAHARKRGWLA